MKKDIEEFKKLYARADNFGYLVLRYEKCGPLEMLRKMRKLTDDALINFDKFERKYKL